ncbi:MAG: RDD family protein [Imperialibacter sp.]|uniref:RDD family protein n=1 Tax=Imperialibacter sp. TaxID=2038411 RepID=UPI0032F07621
MEEQEYPGVLARVKAVIVDGAILLLMMVGASMAFSAFSDVPESVKIAVVIFVFILYDPLLTSLFGGTLGHMTTGIRVKRESDERKNILFTSAIVRFLLKGLLGWISLLTVMGNERRKAIHDYVAGSVVVYKA